MPSSGDGERTTPELLDVVRLRESLPHGGPQEGALATVVHIHNGGEAYEIEVVGEDGRPLFLGPVLPHQVELHWKCPG